MENKLLKSDLLLLLLYSKGSSGKINEPIRGITRLMKLLYLLKMEGGFNDVFSFQPYKMGPFSDEVYPEIEFLKNYPTPDKPLIEIHKQEIKDGFFNPEQFKVIEDISFFEDDEPLTEGEINTEFYLSDVGKKISEKIWNDLSVAEKEGIENIKIKYAGLGLKSLLRYVYKNFPDMTTNSEIKDQIL